MQSANKPGLRFTVELPSAELTLYSDRRAFTQIILNLCSNAIKLTQQGEACLALAQHNQDGQNWTVISVSDTGLGIRREEQAKLFQAFSQADSGMLRAEGTGLGLHLSQKLAALLGGQILLQGKRI